MDIEISEETENKLEDIGKYFGLCKLQSYEFYAKLYRRTYRFNQELPEGAGQRVLWLMRRTLREHKRITEEINRFAEKFGKSFEEAREGRARFRWMKDLPVDDFCLDHFEEFRRLDKLKVTDRAAWNVEMMIRYGDPLDAF